MFTYADLNRNNIETISLDIFDTVLLRKIWPEHFRFYSLAIATSKFLRKKKYKIPPSVIYQNRILISNLEYRTAPAKEWTREGNHKRIIIALIASLGIHEYSLVKKLIQIEIDYEKESLLLNKRLINAVNKAKYSGKRIIAISDMYLSKSSIESILKAHNILHLFDAIYVSSEIGLTKSNGNLFNFISAAEQNQPKSYLHIGDNKHSDYFMALNAGWNSIYCPRNFLFKTINSNLNKITKKIFLG